MNERLKRLLDYLETTLNPRRQTEIELLHRRALGWEPVRRLPLLFTFPIPAEARFQPYPHSQVFDDPEKMLYNELVHAKEVMSTSRYPRSARFTTWPSKPGDSRSPGHPA
jgi:hypothetical protein